MSRIRPLNPRDPRLTEPLYTLREAARYLQVSPGTLHRWAHVPGLDEPYVTLLEQQGGAVPFIGFAEAFVIKSALLSGVPKSKIRPSVEAIRERAGSLEHALASQLVWTDGAEILWGVAGGDLEVAATGQQQFSKTVESYLRNISYGNDGFVEYVRLPQYKRALVTIDPHVAGGVPLVRRGIGIRVEDILDRVNAGDDPAEVARSFKLRLAEVKEVIGST